MMLRRELRPEARPPSIRFRPPNVHLPLWLLAAGWGAVLAYRCLRWAVRHPRSTIIGAVAGWLVLTDRVLSAAVVVCVAGGAGCLWWAMWPGSFDARVAGPVRLRLREHLIYRRHWQPAMLTAGLTLREAWGGDLPTLRRVGQEAGRDVLRVRMLPGQTPAQWDEATARLAQTFGVRSVRVRRVTDRPQELTLVVARKTSSIRHVTEPAPVVETEQAPTGRGAFPRQPRSTTEETA